MDQGFQIAKLLDLDFQRALVKSWTIAEEIVQALYGAPSVWVRLFGDPEEVEEELRKKQRGALVRFLATERELSRRRAIRNRRWQGTP